MFFARIETRYVVLGVKPAGKNSKVNQIFEIQSKSLGWLVFLFFLNITIFTDFQFPLFYKKHNCVCLF